mmetsp:Transcript_46864/g.80644  ORF Transcript_46864/g.80644 Transcript_46864/m.80644 type:complete len:136 (-) Transcript_46864:246-653(-)
MGRETASSSTCNIKINVPGGTKKCPACRKDKETTGGENSRKSPWRQPKKEKWQMWWQKRAKAAAGRQTQQALGSVVSSLFWKEGEKEDSCFFFKNSNVDIKKCEQKYLHNLLYNLAPTEDELEVCERGSLLGGTN